MSGANAAAGREIRNAMELALLQHSLGQLNVDFFDTATDAGAAIDNALATTPDIIVGPLFSSNAQMLRTKKPEYMPAISFTSDATAVGDGVMTMALMPTNSIETIVREIKNDNRQNYNLLFTNNKYIFRSSENNVIYCIAIFGFFNNNNE